MKMPHTGTNRGKRVRVILRSGGEVTGKFEGRTDLWIRVGGRKILKKNIRAFIIDKEQRGKS
jgi:hypothetical protein